MSIKHKYLILLIGVVIVIILGVIIGSVMAIRHTASDAMQRAASKPEDATPDFSFSGMNGWWQGATNKTSMAVFRNDQKCFISAEYKLGTVDVTTALQQIQAGLAKSGFVSSPGAVQALTLQTSAGPQQYRLHQFTVSGSGALKVEGGQAYGYLPLDRDYLFVQASCDTANDLPTTIPALRAISFNTNAAAL